MNLDCLPQTVRVYLNNTTSTGTLDFGRIIKKNKFGPHLLKLVEWSFYSVDFVVSSENNVFTVTYGGTPYSVTIPAGNYQLSGLVSALQTVLQSTVSVNFTVSYSTTTNYITVSVSGVTTFTMTLPARTAELLGFATGTTAVGLSATSSYQPLVQNSQWYIVNLSSGAQMFGYDSNMSQFLIINDAGPGVLVTRGAKESETIVRIDQNVASLVTVSIYDAAGNLLPLGSQPALLVFEIY